jgi:hypothetical protein
VKSDSAAEKKEFSSRRVRNPRSLGPQSSACRGSEMVYASREGVRQAAQMVVNQLGVRPMPQLWSSLNSTPSLMERTATRNLRTAP